MRTVVVVDKIEIASRPKYLTIASQRTRVDLTAPSDVWKPGEEAWVKSFDLVSPGDIVRPDPFERA